MMTDTRARSYDEMVDALATEGLPALQNALAGLAPEDWERPTLLQPPEPGKPPWTVLELGAHFDVFMGLTMGLVAEPTSAQPMVTGPASTSRSPTAARSPRSSTSTSSTTPSDTSGPASSGRCGWMSSWPPGW